MKLMLKCWVALAITIIGATGLKASTVVWNGPAGRMGWHLEVQINSQGAGLGTNWVPLGYSTPNVAVIPIDPGNGGMFYRLAYP